MVNESANIETNPATPAPADGGSPTEARGEPGSPAGQVAAFFARLGPAAWLGVAWTLLPALGGFALLYFIRPASDWLVGLGSGGLVVYALIFTATAGIGILPTYAQAFVGGWAFGLVPGTAAALAGFVGASLVGRVIAKTVARGRVNEEIDRHPKARIVRDALVGKGDLRALGIVTLLRVPPNSPFALTNGVLSTTGVSLWVYLVGTAVGMLPRTAAVVWLGTQIQGTLDGDALKEARPGWWVPVAIGITVVVLIVLAQLGQRAINRVLGPGA